MLALTLGLRALGKDADHVPDRACAAAGRVPVPLARRADPRRARRPRRARPARGRLRERAPDRRGHRLPSTAPPRRQRRPPPRQLAVRQRQSDRRRRHRRRPRSCATSCASSTVALTPEIAEALYVGLVTDTGRFQYTNTTPKALRLAAELVETGADVHGVFQHVYETVQFAKLKLLARALDRATALRGRTASSSRTCSRTISPRSGRRSRTRRGSSTSCARSKAPRWSR